MFYPPSHIPSVVPVYFLAACFNWRVHVYRYELRSLLFIDSGVSLFFVVVVVAVVPFPLFSFSSELTTLNMTVRVRLPRSKSHCAFLVFFSFLLL